LLPVDFLSDVLDADDTELFKLGTELLREDANAVDVLDAFVKHAGI